MDAFDIVTIHYIVIFATSYVIIILALMLLSMHILPDEKLNSFRFARKYLSLSYFVLGLSGFISFFSQQDGDLFACCVLVIASYQALLFTYTILALIQPHYIKRKTISIQLGIISTVGAFLFFALFFLQPRLYTIVFYTVVVLYSIQMIYYTYIFRRSYNLCLHSLEEYYQDDERVRLRWVSFSFYAALAIGIFALLVLFLNLYFYILFSILYASYYAYMVCRFYNYQIDFKYAIPVINQKRVASTEENKDITFYDSQDDLKKKCEEFKCTLDKWVEKREFTQKDISVEDIAESLGVNHTFFQYYFRTHMTTDFRTWRSDLRIREAQRLFREHPELSMEKIRESVGFNHRANFHQQFQKITGMTPTEYKRQQSK